MVSSDDEGEPVAESVTDYHFVDDKNNAISISVLPFLGEDENLGGARRAIFLCGKADGGLQKIYKQVTAWKLDLSVEQHEISVLSRENCWIKLQKPRKSFEDIIRTVLVTVHCLHFVKRNPESSQKMIWKHLRGVFSSHMVVPTENDLLYHLPLIKAMLRRDQALAKSKFLLAFLDNPKKNKTSFEDMRMHVEGSKFFVELGSMDEGRKVSISDDFDDDTELFDSVCAICDNGGEILCCEGRCMRSFHATVEAGAESFCESLRLTQAKVEAIQTFLCRNCRYKQHQCFVCGKLGSSDNSSGAEVFACVSATCGHFYHPACVARLLQRGNEAEAEELRKRIAAGESFTCPVHKCIICNHGENKEVEEMQFAICRRCPKAYHRKCLPRNISLKPIEEEHIRQRAWPGLIPNRLLIYCMRHKIEESLGTPIRNHIIFPDVEKKRPCPSYIQSSIGKVVAQKKNMVSLDLSKEKSGKKILMKVDEGSLAVLESRSMKKIEKSSYELGVDPSKKFKAAETSNSFKDIVKPTALGVYKTSALVKRKRSVNQNLSGSTPSKGLQSIRPKMKEVSSGKPGMTLSSSSMKRSSNLSTLLDSESKNKIMDLIRKTSSSITLEDIVKKYNPPSTHPFFSKNLEKTITQGKVEGSVKAVRTALRKIEDGCSIEDAKAVCEPAILHQIIKWKNKLNVYLAPFLHGMRYTSFGRHFTKVDKLNEIVDQLHWYVQNDDMIVDFSCGANDFSCLMRDKLEETGKKCFFKNYDLMQPKNDFNFERRDWMSVMPQELPHGSRLIMGLNPPFGVKASLANKFINKALQFKPKLLILIVPEETERLDVKESRYDLIWEDGFRLSGKSFYLPGSVDANHKQMDQWNLQAPVLYLWSHPDWTARHMAIAVKEGHTRNGQKVSFTNQVDMQVSDQQSEACDFNDEMDISDDDLPIEHYQGYTEARTTMAEQQPSSSPRYVTCSHEGHCDQGHNDSGNAKKDNHENPGWGDQGKQGLTGDKHNVSKSHVGDMLDGEMLQPSKGTTARSLQDDIPFVASATGSEEAFCPFQHGFSGSDLKFRTGYRGSAVELGDPMGRYSFWLTGSSYGIWGSDKPFEEHVSGRHMVAFGQRDPTKQNVISDMSQIQFDGLQDPYDLSNTKWLPMNHGRQWFANMPHLSANTPHPNQLNPPRATTPGAPQLNPPRATTPFAPQLPQMGSSTFASYGPRLPSQPPSHTIAHPTDNGM